MVKSNSNENYEFKDNIEVDENKYPHLARHLKKLKFNNLALTSQIKVEWLGPYLILEMKMLYSLFRTG